MRKPPEELLAGNLQEAIRLVECGLRRLGAAVVQGADRTRGGAEGAEEAAPAGCTRDSTEASPLLPRRSQVQGELQSGSNSLPFLRASRVLGVPDLLAEEAALTDGTPE